MATANNSTYPVRDSRIPKGRPSCSHTGTHCSRQNFSREKGDPHLLRRYTPPRTRRLCIPLRGTLGRLEFPSFGKTPWRVVHASSKRPPCWLEAPASSILRTCCGSRIGRIEQRKTV